MRDFAQDYSLQASILPLFTSMSTNCQDLLSNHPTILQSSKRLAVGIIEIPVLLAIVALIVASAALFATNLPGGVASLSTSACTTGSGQIKLTATYSVPDGITGVFFPQTYWGSDSLTGSGNKDFTYTQKPFASIGLKDNATSQFLKDGSGNDTIATVPEPSGSCGGSDGTGGGTGTGPYTLSVTKNGSGTVNSNPSGIDCGATCSAPYTSGTNVTLTASPAANSTFANWSGDCSGTSPTCTVTMSAAKNVTANFSASTTTTPQTTTTTPQAATASGVACSLTPGNTPTVNQGGQYSFSLTATNLPVGDAYAKVIFQSGTHKFFAIDGNPIYLSGSYPQARFQVTNGNGKITNSTDNGSATFNITFYSDPNDIIGGTYTISSMVVQIGGVDTHCYAPNDDGGMLITIAGSPTNTPPTKPTTPSGPASVNLNSTKTYNATSTDADDNKLKMDFQVLEPGATSWKTYSSNQSAGGCKNGCTLSTDIAFSLSGQYIIRAMAVDSASANSQFSEWLHVDSAVATPSSLSTAETTTTPPCSVRFSWAGASQSNWGIDVSLQSNFSSYSRTNNSYPSMSTGITQLTADTLIAYYGTGAPTSFVPGNTYYWRIYYGVGGGFVDGSSFTISQCQIPNAKPSVPTGLTSPANNNVAGLYDISASASDPDNDKIYIKFAVRDTTGATSYIDSAWTTSGCLSACTRTVQGGFWIVGTYTVNAIAYDEHGAISSDWSPNYTITIPQPHVDNAAFHSQSGVPSTMTVGQTANVFVSFKNTGNNTWTAGAGNGAYRLGTQNPQDNKTWGTNRVNLTENAPPDGIPTFQFNITAPSTPGTYNFQWQMLKEGANWFGDKSNNVAITVSNAPKPVVTLNTDQPTITAGESSALTWRATNNPTSCSATPSGWFDNTKLASGSATVSPTTTTTYTLNCTNRGGTSDTASVIITVNTLQKPVVTLTSSAAAVTTGGTVTLNWSATNSPTSCTATGAWSGSKSASGSQSVTVNQSSTYTLTCSNAGGTSDPASATVTVSNPLTLTPTISANNNYTGLNYPYTNVQVSNGCVNQGGVYSAGIEFRFGSNAPASANPQYRLEWVFQGNNYSYPTDPGAYVTLAENPQKRAVNVGWTAGTHYVTLKAKAAGYSDATLGPTSFTAKDCQPLPTKPVVTISANPASVTAGGTSTLNWSATNSPTSCTASGAWSGPQAFAATNSKVVTVNQDSTYTLICANSAGPSDSKSVSVTAITTNGSIHVAYDNNSNGDSPCGSGATNTTVTQGSTTIASKSGCPGNDFTSLALGTYTVTAKSIANYDIYACSQLIVSAICNTSFTKTNSINITITASNPAGDIHFKYEPKTPPSDTIAPTAEIVSPTANQDVSGTVDVAVAADDNIAIYAVELYVDGLYVDSTTIKADSYYHLRWPSSGYSTGNHALKAIAYDKSGNSKSSQEVPVNVKPPQNCGVGDPVCDFTRDGLYQDMANKGSAINFYPGVVDYFYNTIVARETGSTYDPNSHNPGSTSGQACGLYQMGCYQNRFLNGEWDDGYTDWRTQTSNAFNYAFYKAGYRYWEPAQARWGEQVGPGSAK